MFQFPEREKERKKGRKREKKEKGCVFARQESVKVNISMKTKQVETHQARERARE